MELQTIVQRYAEAIEYVDVHDESLRANARTGEVYDPGFKNLDEATAVKGIDAAWDLLHPGELLNPAGNRTEIKYPAISRTKCDHIITTDDPMGEDEWGIEVKHIALVGANGNNNDYAVAKMLSPFLKDRGLIHDALRLREYGFTRRVAVIGYCFEYDEETVATARAIHPDAGATLDNISKVIEKNGGSMRPRQLIEFTDAIMSLRGLLTGPRVEAPFEAWRAPAGGKGVVFGFEIRRPQLEPGYDPRHPW